MALRWRAVDPGDAAVTDEDLAEAGLDEVFADRESAEAWLGEYYSDLADLGVTEVELVDGDEVVYRMSLAA